MLNSPIDEIKSRLDIVEVVGSYIKLQKAGVNYRAICPFHLEKTPSFFVSPSRQIWHCFGSCSDGGDIFKFVMKIEGVEFGDALKILAQKAGVELRREDPKLKTQRERLYEIFEIASRFFERQLEESSGGQEAKRYLLGRGITEESIKGWRLGYVPDVWRSLSDFLVSRGYKREEIVRAGLAVESEKGKNPYDRFRGRIMFPVFNFNSQVIGFGGRVFKNEKRPDGQEEAKYINTPNTLLYDKSRVLYGLSRATQEIRKKDNCVLVEGYIDAIMVSQAGFQNVVAVSGTALSDYQLKILKRYSENLLTAFDMDVAGDSATKRGIDLAQTLGFNIKIVTMPQDSDPADIVLQNVRVWENLLQNAKSIHDFYFESNLAKFDKNTLEGKKAISRNLLPVIKRIPNQIEKTYWIKSLAETLEVKEEDILEELGKVRVEEAGFPKEDSFPKIDFIPKTRKELLEEQLVSLAIHCSKNFELINEEDLAFFSPKISQIVNFFKKKEKNLETVLPVDLTETLNYLSLKSEVELCFFDDLKPKEIELYLEKEFKNCWRELKTLVVKDKLGRISKEIKKAEEEKNFEQLQTLIEQFNFYSKSRNDLESA